MKKFRTILIIFASVIIIGHLAFIDFSNMSLPDNEGSYLGIIGMTLVILSAVVPNLTNKSKSAS